MVSGKGTLKSCRVMFVVFEEMKWRMFKKKQVWVKKVERSGT